MKRFSFRLNRLLSLKQSLEERKKNEINKLIADINSIEKEIKNKEKQIEGELKKFSELLLQTADVKLALDWNSYITHLGKEKEDKEKERFEKVENLNNEIKEYLKLLKEKKILLKLKERKYREYLREAGKIERSYIDEQALRIYRGRKVG